MIAAEVSFGNKVAGYLCKLGPSHFVFFYTKPYLNQKDAIPISFAFPLTKNPTYASILFPFFEGLVSEGWLKEKQSALQKIDENDTFSLLLNNGEDLIGAISVKKIAWEDVNDLLQNLSQKN